MTSFAEKSQQSLTAAEMLYKSNLYPSTINRAYYSFFQFMQHILFAKLNQDEKEFEGLINSSGKKTHSLVTNLVGIQFIKNRPNGYSTLEWNREYQWLSEKIAEFKKIRNEADYFEVTINPEDANSWIGNRNAMINLLKKAFK